MLKQKSKLSSAIMLGGFLMAAVSFSACNNDGGDSKKDAPKTDSPKMEEPKKADTPAPKMATDTPLIKGTGAKPTGTGSTPPPAGGGQ